MTVLDGGSRLCRVVRRRHCLCVVRRFLRVVTAGSVACAGSNVRLCDADGLYGFGYT